MQHAYTDNFTDYKETILVLLRYNGLVILSNGMDSRVGSVTARWEHFAEWKRINSEGELIIDARRFRSQEKNREDAIRRLKTIIEKASYKPPQRKETRPSKAAVEKRLSAKKQQSQRKQDRQKNWSMNA